jgi:DNA-binding LacI/PurR family transcriptional regulator
LPELCAEFGVSQFTVRTALKQMEADGYVSCEPGRGTFVQDRRQQRSGPMMVTLLLIDVSPESNFDYQAVVDNTERYLSLEKRIPFSWASLTSEDIVRGHFPAILESGYCGGVLLDGFITPAHLALRERFGIDMVVVGNHEIPREVPQVRIRAEEACREAALRLARRAGRPVVLAVEPLRLAVTRDLAAGYAAALDELEQQHELIYFCDKDAPPPCLLRELAGETPPAVITTETILPRIDAACRQAGIDPPSDRPLLQMLITSRDYMRMGVERLVEMMEGKRTTILEELPLELVETGKWTTD